MRNTLWTTVAVMLALAASALASTRIYSGGVITRADPASGSFVVAETALHGYDFQMAHAVIKEARHSFEKSNAILLLDGQPASRAQALKVGNLCRKIHIKSDGGVAEFFSPDSPLLKPADACLVLGLIGTGTKDGGPYLQVRLEYKAGKLQRAWAAKGAGHPPLFGEQLPADATGLNWDGGKLTGTIKVGTHSVTLDGSVNRAAVWGTFQAGEVAGEINGAFDYPVEQFPPAVHLVLPAGWGGAPTNGPLVAATVKFKDPKTAEVIVHLPAVKAEKVELALSPGGLKGSFVMAVEAPGFKPGNYTVQLATQNSLGATAGIGSAILKGKCDLTRDGETISGKVGTVAVGLWNLAGANKQDDRTGIDGPPRAATGWR